MKETTDVYVTYEYLGNDERITKRKGYAIIDGIIKQPKDIELILFEIKSKLKEKYNIDDDSINPYEDILVTYILDL